MQLRGPHIPLKTGRKDGRKSKTNVVELFRPNHNKSIFVVLDKFGAIGIDTPSIVALLGTIHSPLTHPCTYIYEMTTGIKHIYIKLRIFLLINICGILMFNQR